MNNTVLFAILVGAFGALAAVHWIYFKILKIAVLKGLTDNPDARKLQKRPVPVVGGLAVYFGLLAGMLLAATFCHLCCPGDLHRGLFPVFTAMSIMLYVGAMDDIMGLTPASRFAIEIGTILCLIFSSGMCIDTFRGLWGIGEFSWWIAVPLTVVAGVGIINAVNMIDGVNGLSSGLCFTSCVLFGITFVHAHDVPNAILAFSMAGAIVPFYVHNVFGAKSRMFIGDAGTMVLGVLITWFVICLLSKDSETPSLWGTGRFNMIAFALAVMSVPVFDTLRVMTQRVYHKQSPFHPDKTHLHHAFIKVGVSHFITSTVEILLSLLVTGIWRLSVALGAGLDLQLYIVIACAVLFVWGTYALLSYHARNHTEFMHRLSGFSVRTHLGRTSWWKAITGWLDSYIDFPMPDPQMMAVDEHISRIEEVNYKEIDRKAILEYMKGKAEVHVDDIIENSGAERLRVYSILFEEEQDGYVVVLRSSAMGAPEIVSLKSEF
jgi:UDP-GlcNAc:undecaprenyl-phosphate/decaprenyl-phosphate GlcNAc-1-phosphate transferase